MLIKRSMDIVGSGIALVLCSPLFLVLSAIIKLTSQGPVFFRQSRVSQYGKHFTFLKFRSMKVATSDTIHKDYVKNFIAGKAEEPFVRRRHRRRLLEVKPGITGLWQIHGRSSTTFDEMVRLDLQYSRTWSPMLDVKILLDTPRAVLMGDGAY